MSGRAKYLLGAAAVAVVLELNRRSVAQQKEIVADLAKGHLDLARKVATGDWS